MTLDDAVNKMHEENKQTIINKNKRDNLDLSKKLNLNKVMHDGNASAQHRFTVEGICKTLKTSGIDFYARAVFKSGNICDIYIPVYNVVFEALDSESDDDFIKKDFGTALVIPLRCGQMDKNECCLLEENKRLKIENECLKKKILSALKHIKSTMGELVI